MKKRINACTDAGLRKQLQNILLNSSEDEDNHSSSSSESSFESYSSDADYDTVSTMSSEQDCNCQDDNCLCALSFIQVISKEDNVFLDAIDAITDEVKKRTLLEQYLQILHQNSGGGESSSSRSKKDTTIIDPGLYSLQKVFDKASARYKEPSLKDLNKTQSQLQQQMTEIAAANTTRDVLLADLQAEVRTLKKEIKWLKNKAKGKEISSTSQGIHINEPEDENCFATPTDDEDEFAHLYGSINETTIQRIDKVISQKYFFEVTIIIAQDYTFKATALFDTGADLNCISEGLIPSQYYAKTAQKLNTASGSRLLVDYKVSDAVVCNNGLCLSTPFMLVKNMMQEVILGHPFISQLIPYSVDSKGIKARKNGHLLRFDFLSQPKTVDVNKIVQQKEKFLFQLQEEIQNQRIADQISTPQFQAKLSQFRQQMEKEICSDIPNAFWERKKHSITLPYEDDFNERMIPTKARPIQMNERHLQLCHEEIESLLNKGLIRKSYSPWSCPAFYVENNAELERGVPRLVINYKPLNKVLKWIRYPIPNKKDLLNRLLKARIFSKFDMKSGFWQIQIQEEDRYKTAFTVPFGHFEWNVQPFGLKNAPSEFQRIMNDIFMIHKDFLIVYIDDVLIFSDSIEQHWKHLQKFQATVKREGLVVSAKKIQLFQTSIRFLGHIISNGQFKPIDRAIAFAEKFPDEIKDKQQLQRFLGSLNYISEFYQDLALDAAPLYKRLAKKPKEWTEECTMAVQKIKLKAKVLPCLHLTDPNAFKIIETDASDLGYGGILKQRQTSSQREVLVRFTSGIWNDTQKNYSTIKKEILSIVLCISKFQDDILNQKFLLRVDCKSAKEVLEKDVKNIASKQIFARWQAILAIFEFDIEFIKGESNSLPDFLTREFLQNPQRILTVCSIFCRDQSQRTAKPAYERIPDSPSTPISRNKDKGKGVASSSSAICEYSQISVKGICIIDQKDESETIENLAAKYLTQALEYPGDIPKTRIFYEKILLETGSITVQHRMRDQNNIAFSTVHIKRILTPEDWQKDIRKPIFFHEANMSPKTYNYFDYMRAWEAFLNYQNSQRSHSWFLLPKMSPQWTAEEIPAWFYGWFFHFGITESHFPPELISVFSTFRGKYPDLSPVKSMTCFTLLYHIPWIISWELSTNQLRGINLFELVRRYFIKWWTKFDINPILDDFADQILPDKSSGNKKQKQDALRVVLKGFSPKDLKAYLAQLEAEEQKQYPEDEDDDSDQDSQMPPAFF